MKKIKDFIEGFIKAEYNFNYAEYNMEVSGSECVEIAKKTNFYFHEYNSPKYDRVTSITERKDDPKWEKRYKQKTEKIIPRTLFQIKHYKNPDLGGNLKKIITTEDIYACYVSYEQNVEIEIGFSRRFYAADTKGGLKIIYLDRYDRRDGTWEGQHDLEVLQVISSGELVAIEKYQAPEEETSLAAYNKD